MENQTLPNRPRELRSLCWAGTAAIASLAVALQMRIFDRASVPMDEGQLVVVATRILDGEILYRDIHTGIGPGIYHFTALLFRLFGEDLLVTRWAQVGVNTAIAICLWSLAVRVIRLHWAALPPLAFILLITVGFPVLTMLNYSSLALATALAALLVFHRHLDSGRAIEGVVVGVLLALTALTKQNYGVLAIGAIGISLVWNRPSPSLATRGLWRSFASIAAGGGLLALATAVYFGAHGAFEDLIGATLLDIGGAQLGAFDNPIPPIFGSMPSSEPRFIFLYTPPSLFNHMLEGGTLFDRPITLFLRESAIRLSYGIPLMSLALAPLLVWRMRHRSQSGPMRESRSIVVFAGVFFLGIFPSAIWSHLAFVIPPTLLVLALLLDHLETQVLSRFQQIRWPAITCAIALLVLCAISANRVGQTVASWYPIRLDLPRATLFVTPNQAALYRGASRFVEACAGPGESIFVAPDIPIIYFLTGRRNPTPYELTIPGNVDGRLIIEALDRSETRCIVYNPIMYPEFPAFQVLFPELAHYLRMAYHPVAVIPGVGTEWQGLNRRDAALP